MEIVPTFMTAQGVPIDEDLIAKKLEEERERRKKRSERFGIELKEPSKEKVIRQSEDLGEVVKVKRYYPKGEVEYANFKNIDKEERESVARKEQRAQRYGQMVAEEEKLQAEEEATYDAMEIEEAEKGSLIAAAKGELRPEALHLHGTDDMSTADVFRTELRYFGEHHVPTFIEWINDSSCNAVFENKEKSRAALMALTEPLKDVAGTPFENYRKGRDWRVNSPILMRFATTEDKKDTKKRKSKYYETYGLPNQRDDRGGKRRRLDKEKAHYLRDSGRQVAIAPIETHMRMDIEEGEEIKILIENDLFAADAAPSVEEVEGRNAPPSTPVGPPPSSPSSIFANIARRDAEILREQEEDVEEEAQGDARGKDEEKGIDEGYEEEEEGDEPID